MKERHRMILRYDLMGKTNKQIANLTGYSRQHVSQVKNKDSYKIKKARMRRELNDNFLEAVADDFTRDPVRVKLQEVKTTALDVLVELMTEAESEHVRMKCAHDLLDRAGYKPKNIVEQKTDMKINDDKILDDVKSALTDVRKIQREMG